MAGTGLIYYTYPGLRNLDQIGDIYYLGSPVGELGGAYEGCAGSIDVGFCMIPPP